MKKLLSTIDASFYWQVGGNGKAKDFFKNQADYRDGMSIHEKYNSKAAALYRDKVSLHRFVLKEISFPGTQCECYFLFLSPCIENLIIPCFDVLIL